MTSPVAPAGRRTDLDLLRIVVCAAVVLAHALLIFADEPRYHLKSPVISPVASVLYAFLRLTTLSGFFMLAGWSAVTSLRRRTPLQFMKERVVRLLVPLAAGMIVLGPVIKYVELRDGRDLGMFAFRLVAPLRIGFPEFLTRYFGRVNLITWSHLWFLAYLFLFSLVLLPVLVRLARRAPPTTVPAGWVVFLPILPIAVALLALRGYWPFLPNLFADGPNLVFFGLCLLIGAGMAAWPGFEQRLQTQVPLLAAIGLIGFAGMAVFGETQAGRVCAALTAWGVAGAVLGFAARHAPRHGRTMAYLGEATLPVHILHHVPVLLIGVAVLRMDLPVGIAVLLIWLPATAVSLAVYHWLVRPFGPMRFLLGMAPLRRAPPIPPDLAPIAATGT
jgi:peptidoglycan/LPS O-acetylase OafA/YrhL